MIDHLTEDELKELMRVEESFCVSIYLPTHRAGAEVQQDKIRLKNLLTEADRQLQETGMSPAESQSFLRPANDLLADNAFWKRQSDGLAIFVAPGTFQRFRLPLDFDDLLVVSHRYHLKPLLPLFNSDGEFYLLALSQNKVRLLRGSRYRVSEIKLEDMPTSYEEALKWDDPEKQLQFHSSTQPDRGGRAAVFYGHGGSRDDEKENLVRYFRKIDGGLRKVLEADSAPMVLAAVDYLFPLYREANTYPRLLEQGVSGNPDELDAKSLHERAWPIVEPLFQQAMEQAAAQYQDLSGTEQTSEDVKEIVSAAFQAKVGRLFVVADARLWGDFDAQSGEVEFHDEQRVGSQDLLDFAAVQTMLNGGRVFAVSAEEVPSQEAPLAAIFRY